MRFPIGLALAIIVSSGLAAARYPTDENRGEGVTLLSPNGGEYWIGGEVHQVNWTGTDPGGLSSLSYSNYSNVGPWNPIAANVSAPYNWSLPDDATNSAWVRVEVRNSTGALIGTDVSDNPFTMERAPERFARVIFPDGGERFANGSAVFIRWSSDFGPEARASVSVTCGGIAGNYTGLGRDLPAVGMQLWAANFTGGQCFARVEVADSLRTHIDHSDAAFQVYERPRVRITAPETNASFRDGEAVELRWNTSGGAARLLVNVSVSWRGEPPRRIASGLEDPGTLNIELPGLNTTNGSIFVEVYDELGNNASDEVRNLTIELKTPPLGTVAGFVFAPEGPLLNARLFLYLYGNDSPPLLVQTGTTGADGNFTFVQLQPGAYLLKVDAPGFEPAAAGVGVDANRTSWANLTLKRPARAEIDTATAWRLAITILVAGGAVVAGLLYYRRWRKAKPLRAAEAPPAHEPGGKTIR